MPLAITSYRQRSPGLAYGCVQFAVRRADLQPRRTAFEAEG